jgi:UDP-GlcNAc:undecaprenyl-phosphate/decaprenyl-phosphate GlcNAc-1-phosphate transferase
MENLASAIVAAFLASVAITWVMRRLAWATGVLDVPDGVRKLHGSPVPLLGGVAVFGAWLVGMTVGKPSGAGAAVFPAFLGGGAISGRLLLAACIVVVAGICDDLIGLRARWKLLGQLCAALALVAGGLVIKRLSFYDRTIELGWSGTLLTLVWLVGSMNAINMMDGLDGLAATLGVTLCLALAFMAWMTAVPDLVLVALTFAAALAGFLVHNLPPARIYLGDAGSSLIGLVIGAVALEGSFKTPATVAMAAPFLVLTVPIFDGLAAVIRRRLTGRPITAPDRGHIHYSLRDRGWNNLQVLGGLAGLCALTCAAAVLGVYLRRQGLALLTAAAVVIGCVVTRFFGYYEYLLLVGGRRVVAKAMAQKSLLLPSTSPARLRFPAGESEMGPASDTGKLSA